MIQRDGTLKWCIMLQETHILHEFGTQLHGQLLKVCILDYIRPERNFNSIGQYTLLEVKRNKRDLTLFVMHRIHDFCLEDLICIGSCNVIVI